MNEIHYLALIMVIVALLAGCAVPDAPAVEPVDEVPTWTEPEQISPGDPNPEIRIFYDNSQSMVGFSGMMDSPIGKVAVELTNLARFDEKVSTYRLIPNEEYILNWEKVDPLIIASSVLVRDKAGYTYTGGFQYGGPLTAAFEQDPDPGEVRILITDLLEQESELDVLISYVERQFRFDSRQQMRLYVGESGYEGFVSYPVVEENELQVKTTYYAGQRPFAVIVVGPAAGVERVHQVMLDTQLPFARFMVENHRPEAEQVSFRPGLSLSESILVEDPGVIRCTANLEEHSILKDCYAYAYRKIAANKSSFSRLSLTAQMDAGTELSLGRVNWYRWEQQVDEAGVITHRWERCEAPEDVVLALVPVGSGPVVPGRDVCETGLEDIAVPAGSRLWELSILTGDTSAGVAFAVQVELTVPGADNPLASTEAFENYDISFAAYGNADKDPEILTRIPDLELMLSALTKLDDAAAEKAVADVRIVIQNYETTHHNNKEEE